MRNSKEEYCYCCNEGRPLTEDHVIPQAIGGKLKVPLCVECHKKVHPIDTELTNNLQKIATLLNVKREDRKENRHFKVKQVETGIEFVIDSRRGQRAHPEVKIKFDENGFPIPEVKAGSKRELNNILKGIKKKYGQIAQTTEITAEPISLGVVEYENTVGGRLFMRSVAKTAYLFLASRLPKEKVLSDAFKSIRDFIFEDQGESLTSFNFVHTKFMSNDTRPLLRYCLNPLTGNEISVKREFVLPDVTTDECLTPVQTTQFVFTEIEKGLRKIELYCESISKTTVEFLEPQTT